LTKALNGRVVGCIVTVYADKSFDIEIKTSPVSALIKDAIKIEKGSPVPHTQKVGKITKDQIRKIAEEKIKDLNTTSLDAAMRIVMGSARSMGVTVEGM
jgi:large subunit ribosomal protein L11